MFKQARLKLTLWYLMILTVILLLFSLMIYRIGCLQLERSYYQADMRLRAQQSGLALPPINGWRWQERIKQTNELSAELRNDYTLAKQELSKNLMILNFTIMVIASVLAYFLAGKTLSPIEEMVTEQRRFVTDAAHELRTPITAMKTALEVSLRAKKISKTEALGVLQDNLKDIEELEKLINQLLALSTYQNEQRQLFLEKRSFFELADQLQRKFRGLLVAKNLKLKFSYPKQEVLMDFDKLEQLLTILIDNAINYSKPGKKIEVIFKHDKKTLKIMVKDQGTGMSQTDQEQIFKRFYRADQARTKKDSKTGFGLGLAIAWRIVELYGGKISVQSQLNHGSTFSVYLPN